MLRGPYTSCAGEACHRPHVVVICDANGRGNLCAMCGLPCVCQRLLMLLFLLRRRPCLSLGVAPLSLGCFLLPGEEEADRLLDSLSRSPLPALFWSSCVPEANQGHLNWRTEGVVVIFFFVTFLQAWSRCTHMIIRSMVKEPIDAFDSHSVVGSVAAWRYTNKHKDLQMAVLCRAMKSHLPEFLPVACLLAFSHPASLLMYQ